MPSEMKRLTIRIISLVVLSIVALSLWIPFHVAQADTGTLISTTTAGSSWATNNQFQRKLLYMNGRLWAIYSDGGTSGIRYKTSTDNGSTWSAVGTIKSTAVYNWTGHAIALAYDGTNFHYAFNGATAGDHLYYRKGTPNADGTITWVAAEQDVANPGAANNYMYANIIIDSGGDPWIGVTYKIVSPSNDWRAVVYKSSTSNGTWTTDAGFPYTLQTGNTNILPAPVGSALTGGKTYWIWSTDSYTTAPLQGKLYDSGWGATENATYVNNGYTNWSTVADGDDVHIAYYDWGPPAVLRYYKRTYGVGWGGDYTISSSDAGQANSMSRFGDDSVIVFWHNADGYVRYKKKTNGVWGSEVTQWIDETADTLATSLNFQTIPDVGATLVEGLMYVTKAASPYNIKYASLSMLTAPTVTTSAASSVEATTARLNGEVTDTGGDNPTVTVYWGDDDAGEVAGNWDNNSVPTSPAQPQGAATFYKDATGLNVDTLYYFKAKATNSVGTDWSITQNFTTTLPLPLAPTGITITEITNYSINITWTKGTYADNTTIIGKSLDYPSSLTDGYIVYSGNGTSYQFNEVDLDETEYYFSFWSWNDTGYSVDYATAKIGGDNVTLIAILILVLGMTLLAYIRTNIATCSISALLWLFFWAYTRNNPIPGTATGDFTDSIIYYGSFMAMIAVFFIYLSRRRREKALTRRGYVMGEDGQVAGSERITSKQPLGMMNMSDEEYRQRVRRALHPRRRR